jgi:penicillin-binding protein 1A
MEPDDRIQLVDSPEPYLAQPAGARVSTPSWAAHRTFGERLSDFWAHPRTQVAMRVGVIAGSVLLIAGVILWNVLFVGMPRLPHSDALWTLNRAPAVQFVDAKGRTVAVRGHLYGPVVRGDELPPYLGQAFIAAEDQRFMEHSGIDLQSIARAAMANFSAGRTVQGGSTLTQQLVKNLLVGNDQNLRRKAQEARLAMEMEAALTKQEILDLYLNRVYLGANAYGVEAAADTYFGKPAAELSLAEAAFLAALPKAPSRYAEDKTGPETTARVHYVLDRMVASGFITPDAALAAKGEKLAFVDATAQEPISGYVLDVAMKEALAVVPDLPPDAVITLTVDGGLQRRAEAALKAALGVRRLGASEGAVVVMDRHGPIRALVGGTDYSKSQFNRATQALRQPGSAFKTFVYATALESGLEPTTIRVDAPVEISGWAPANYEDEYRGPITLAHALAVSSNSVAAQIGQEVGPRQIVKLAKRFGIESPLQAYPSIALGADEVTLLEMTRAYGVLSNGGRQPQPYMVSEIRDQRGAVLYRAPEADEPRVFDGDATTVLTGMLANVVQSGTGVQAKVAGWDIAGKTGTSQSWRDAWFVGYSSRLVGGVWIGNDDERAMRKVTGGGAAAALFSKVMTAAHRDMKPEPLPGAELGAAWLGTEILDPLEEEWFLFPEVGPVLEFPEFLPPAGQATETPIVPDAAPLPEVVPSTPGTLPPALPIPPVESTPALPPAPPIENPTIVPQPSLAERDDPLPEPAPVPQPPAVTPGRPS